jgi:nucleotidyltransferase substrate binding protein (TIGR01987 family)
VELKLNEFKKAIEGFSYLVGVDLKSMENVLDKRLIDGIENGMIQKFEYSIELGWKLIKQFLKQEDGIDAKTPKQSVKEFYLAGYIDEDNYLKLIDMIDDRNNLSHIYDEDEFRKIIKKFSLYVKVFEKIEQVINGLLATRGTQETV